MAVNYDMEWGAWDWKVFLGILAIYLLILACIIYDAATGSFDKVETDTWNKCVIKTWWFGDDCISMWPISHFLLYLAIGLVLPEKYYKYFIVAGVLWEIGEYIGGECLPKDKREFNRNVDGNRQYKQWLTGKFGDIVANLLGLSLGFALKIGFDKGYSVIKTKGSSTIKTAGKLEEISAAVGA